MKFDTTANTVVTKVSLVKMLSLRGNSRRLCRAKHLPLRNWTYGDSGFYSGQTSYHRRRVFKLHFLKLHYSTTHASTALLMVLLRTLTDVSQQALASVLSCYIAQIQAHNSSMAIYCPASWLSACVSSCLYLASIILNQHPSLVLKVQCSCR